MSQPPATTKSQNGTKRLGDIELWKIKKLVKNLEAMSGTGTGLITLNLPGKTQLGQVQKFLTDE
jgi:peptide chain release factor subunit 1